MASPFVLSRFAHEFRHFAAPAPGSIKPPWYAGYDAIRKQAENGNLTGHVFIDLSKPFDTISHAGSTEKVYKQWIFSEIAFIPTWILEKRFLLSRSQATQWIPN